MFFTPQPGSLGRSLRIVAVACAVFFHHVDLAQAIGPDKYGYTAAAITVNFEDLTIPGVNPVGILDNTDDIAVTIPIGFKFVFYGVSYNTVSVSSNGLLSFQNVDTEYNQVNLATAAPLHDLPMICPFWHDWEFLYLGTDSAYYATLGAPGSRRLIVQWNFAQSASGTGTDTVTFQVKLFEGSNNIEFHYDDATIDDDSKVSNGRDTTVGIRDIAGQISGRNLQWSYNAANIADDTAVRYVAPQFKVKTVTRVASNKHIILNCLGAPGQLNKIESTTSLGTVAFTLLGTATADATGAFTFEDANAGTFTSRFYRVALP
jgi:hypothetical protein